MQDGRALKGVIEYPFYIKFITIFSSILVSEEDHIDWLETQLDLIDRVGLENYQQAQM
jgi:bacterioferritin (cytochrome b1)